MHRFSLLFIIALLIAPSPVAHSQTQTPSLKPFTPLVISNDGSGTLTAKIIGPAVKTLKLGYGEKLVVLLPPGEYYCLYQFKGEPKEPLIYKKTARFQVPSPNPDRPIEVFASEEDHSRETLKTEVRSVMASSANEFNDKGAATSVAEGTSLQLNTFNVVIFVDELFYGETPAQKRQKKTVVLNHLNRYVRGVLIPKLTRQGFKVRNLGERLEPYPDTFPTEPTLLIEYSEAAGQAYTMYSGYGEPSVYGVEISCSLGLYHPAVFPEAPIWSASLTASNDESIQMNFFANKEAVMHNQALKYLREQLNDLAVDLNEWAPRGAAATTPGPVTPVPPKTRPRRSGQ